MRGRRLVASMSPTLKLGKMANTRGCCPICGHDVALRQSFNGVRLLESYACYRCGPTSYTVALA
jgi:hypothetical protein